MRGRGEEALDLRVGVQAQVVAAGEEWRGRPGGVGAGSAAGRTGSAHRGQKSAPRSDSRLPFQSSLPARDPQHECAARGAAARHGGGDRSRRSCRPRSSTRVPSFQCRRPSTTQPSPAVGARCAPEAPPRSRPSSPARGGGRRARRTGRRAGLPAPERGSTSRAARGGDDRDALHRDLVTQCHKRWCPGEAARTRALVPVAKALSRGASSAAAPRPPASRGTRRRRECPRRCCGTSSPRTRRPPRRRRRGPAARRRRGRGG